MPRRWQGGCSPAPETLDLGERFTYSSAAAVSRSTISTKSRPSCFLPDIVVSPHWIAFGKRLSICPALGGFLEIAPITLSFWHLLASVRLSRLTDRPAFTCLVEKRPFRPRRMNRRSPL